MHTFRRLNDPERYYGLSWRGWLARRCAGGLLYVAVRVSPFGLRPTITIAVLVLALAGVVLYGLSGQAIGPGRYLLALVALPPGRQAADVPERPDRHGLVLDSAPRPDRRAGRNEPGLLAELEVRADEPQDTRTGSLGEVLPVAAVEPDGLIVTTDGRGMCG